VGKADAASNTGNFTMSLRTKLSIAALAGAVLIASAATAFASPAIVGNWAKVYSQPGWGAIDTVLPGEFVEVGGCAKGYCFIRHPGPDGWVKAGALDFGPVAYPGRWHRGWDRGAVWHGGYGPGFYGDDFAFCAGGPNAHFCIAH
jgi:hypothetical protein